MPNRSISEDYKIDVCINGVSTVLPAAEQTPPLSYSMEGYDRALFIVSAGSFISNNYGQAGLGSSTPTVLARLLQAQSATGATILLGASQQYFLGSTNGNLISGGEVVFITVGSDAQPADSMTVNGVTFTYNATQTSTQALSATRLIPTTGGDSVIVCNTLASYINDATFGCAGLHATVELGNGTTVNNHVKIVSEPYGDAHIDASVIQVATSSSVGATVLGLGRVVGYLEVDARELASASSYTHVSIGVTPGSSFPVNVTLLRGSAARYSPPRGQYVQDYYDAVT